MEEEVDGLPLPCVCRMLREGWRRRPSASYSQFHDGDGTWALSEEARASMARKGSSASLGGRRRSGQGSPTEGLRSMPLPTIVADVLIGHLSFSLR